MHRTHNWYVVSNRHMLFHSTHNLCPLSGRHMFCGTTNEYVHYYPVYADRALESWHRQQSLLFSKIFCLWGPHSILFKGYQASSPGVKKPGHEFSHSPPSSAGIKNEWIDTTFPSPSTHGFHVVDRIFFFFIWLYLKSVIALDRLLSKHPSTLVMCST